MRFVDANTRHVGVDAAARTHWLEGAFLEHAQQFGLRREVDFGDFVQQQRTTLRQLEAADSVRVGTRECTPAVAKEFTFGELLGENRAIEADQLGACPATTGMDGPGD